MNNYEMATAVPSANLADLIRHRVSRRATVPGAQVLSVSAKFVPSILPAPAYGRRHYVLVTISRKVGNSSRVYIVSPVTYPELYCDNA